MAPRADSGEAGVRGVPRRRGGTRQQLRWSQRRPVDRAKRSEPSIPTARDRTAERARGWKKKASPEKMNVGRRRRLVYGGGVDRRRAGPLYLRQNVDLDVTSATEVSTLPEVRR